MFKRQNIQNELKIITPLENELEYSETRKNILFFLNPSNGISLECDSGITFNKLLIDELIQIGHNISVVGQIDPKIKDTTHYYLKQGNDKYSVRFNFNLFEFQEIIKNNNDLDVFFLNQSEHGYNIKSVLISKQKTHVKLISYMHYLSAMCINDNSIVYDPSLNQGNLAVEILRRELSTAEISDYVLIHSEYGKNLLLNCAEIMNYDISKEKIKLLPAPVDLNLHPDSCPSPHDRKVKLLYNNRLYDHYGINTIQEYLSDFKKSYNLNFELILTNPTNGRSSLRNNLDTSVNKNLSSLSKLNYVKIDHRPNYSSYHDLLKESTIGIAPYRPPLWSMSAIDMMASWRPVIAPKMGSYPDFIPKNLLYYDKDSFSHILFKLISDTNFYQNMQIECRKIAECVDSKIIGSKLNEIIGVF